MEESAMTHILVHISTGIENPSKAALGLFVARAVVEEGHRLTLFVAADGVNLLRREVVDGLVGLGTGAVAEHLGVIGKSEAAVFYSGLSAKSRGLKPDDLVLPTAQPGSPAKLVQLTVEAERVLCY
jgi:uncharacterized protein